MLRVSGSGVRELRLVLFVVEGLEHDCMYRISGLGRLRGLNGVKGALCTLVFARKLSAGSVSQVVWGFGFKIGSLRHG